MNWDRIVLTGVGLGAFVSLLTMITEPHYMPTWVSCTFFYGIGYSAGVCITYAMADLLPVRKK